MTLDTTRIRAVLLDYGSTLIEFSPRHVSICDAALASALEARFGPLDRGRFQAIRDANRSVPYEDGYRENSIPAITVDLIRRCYGVEPSPAQLDELVRVRFDAFVGCIELPPGVERVLKTLRSRYRLGLVSNYPDGDAIRASLARVGLADMFEVVVVSGDVGYIKPHPRPFQVALESLGVAPAEALHVGDNWLADVQGAKRLGMQVVLSRQWEAPERFERQPGDHEPDLVIAHLNELTSLVHGRSAPSGCESARGG